MLVSFTSVSGIGLLGFAAVVAAYDTRFREIPNGMNVFGAGLGFGLGLSECLATGGLAGTPLFISNVALGMLVAACVSLPLWRVGALGGGDVKFLVASGTFVGPLFALKLLSYSLLTFTVLAMLRFLREGRLVEALRRSFGSGTKPALASASATDATRLVPFGPAVLLGACLAILIR